LTSYKTTSKFGWFFAANNNVAPRRFRYLGIVDF
jgi:hypothetical protein